MNEASSIGDLASYSANQTGWIKIQFKKIKETLSAAVTSFIGEVFCTSKSIGILSLHKRPKRERLPTNRLKSIVEKYEKSTKRGRGKGREEKLMWRLYLKLNKVPPELCRKIRIYLKHKLVLLTTTNLQG